MGLKNSHYHITQANSLWYFHFLQNEKQRNIMQRWKSFFQYVPRKEKIKFFNMFQERKKKKKQNGIMICKQKFSIPQTRIDFSKTLEFKLENWYHTYVLVKYIIRNLYTKEISSLSLASLLSSRNVVKIPNIEANPTG